MQTQSSHHWLNILEAADIWCAEVFNYEQLRKQEGYKQLQMEQEVETSAGIKLTTTRCPIRIDGEILLSAIGAPALGEHTKLIEDQYDLS